MKILFSVFSLFLLSQTSVSAEQMLPSQLAAEGKRLGCSQIADFYNRPGMIEPMYVYGVLPGNKEESAGFWCQKQEAQGQTYLLVIWAKKASACQTTLETKNYPGGLSVSKVAPKSMDDYRKVKSTGAKTGQSFVIEGYYDGIVNSFVCKDGDWYTRRLD